MAMSASECPVGTACAGQVPPGYGIVLDTSWSIKKYRLYADTNGDNEFWTPPDTIIEPVEPGEGIKLEEGIIIKEISLPPNTYSLVSINFKPPDPAVNIKFNVGSPGQPKTVITLALETDPNKTKIVEVNNAGLIEVK